MTSCADLRILFRAPAGLRLGLVHLLRCRWLARTLGVRPLVALRGTALMDATALALGCDVVRGGSVGLLQSLAPDVLVVDDPATSNARRWIAAGRDAGCLVVSVDAFGTSCLNADLVIQGRVTMNACVRGMTPVDPRCALFGPSLLEDEEPRDPYSVLVAPGDDAKLELALDIAQAIVNADPRTTVRLAEAFLGRAREHITSEAASQTSEHGRNGAASLDTVLALPRSAGRAVLTGENLTQNQAFEAVETARLALARSLRQEIASAGMASGGAFVAHAAAGGSAHGPVPVTDGAQECVSLLSDAAMRRRVRRGQKPD